MRDAYLYEDCDVLKNLLGIKDKKLLDEAEAEYVVMRLKEVVFTPLPGDYGYDHLMKMHHYIFQDLFEWAGQQRKLNIYKEEPVLGGLSIDYSDVFDIPADASRILSKMVKKPWPDRELFENNAQYVRTAMVAYNAIFDDLGDKSKPEYLITFVEDAIGRGREKRGST